MTIISNLPLALSPLDFSSQQDQDFKIERPYMEERWLLEWRKNLGILRTRFNNEYFDNNSIIKK
jgi:hypothetical protein